MRASFSSKNLGHRRILAMKSSLFGLASVRARESLQSTVSLQVIMNLSWKALPLSPLEPAWIPLYILRVVSLSAASK